MMKQYEWKFFTCCSKCINKLTEFVLNSSDSFHHVYLCLKYMWLGYVLKNRAEKRFIIFFCKKFIDTEKPWNAAEVFNRRTSFTDKYYVSLLLQQDGKISWKHYKVFLHNSTVKGVIQNKFNNMKIWGVIQNK